MGRLIDENSVIENAEKCAFTDKDDRRRFLEFVKYCVKEAPTAYDVDAVVVELEKANEKIAKEDYCRTKYYIENDCEHKDCFKCCAEYLIDIVRKGGVE